VTVMAKVELRMDESNQGLALVDFSYRPEPFLALKPGVFRVFSGKNGSGRAENWMQADIEMANRGRYCSPRHRVPFNSRKESSKCVG